MDDLTARRLLAHVMAADTRWFKVSFALLKFGRHNVPEERDSHNPVKWAAAQLGAWMDEEQRKHTNRRFDREEKRRGRQ